MDPAAKQAPPPNPTAPAAGGKKTPHTAAKHKTPTPHYHQERRRHSRRSKHLRSLQLVNLLLAVALVVVFIGWINTWVNLNAADKERYLLASDLRQTTNERDALHQRNQELNNNLKTLVEQRLPGLHHLSFDTTVPIDNGYVRNISFTRTGVGDGKRFEYSLVLENRDQDALTPKVRILLFDESGIQSGSATLTKEASTSNNELEFLEPGEIRAYTAPISMDRGKRPVYFKVYAE